jgi:UDPglucose 6-dehydrogenase
MTCVKRPCTTLINALCAAGALVRAYDPVATNEARRIAGSKEGFELVESAEEAMKDADALAIVTEWQEFRSPDFKRMKELLKQPVIFDGRNLYDPGFVKLEGFRYFALVAAIASATIPNGRGLRPGEMLLELGCVKWKPQVAPS